MGSKPSTTASDSAPKKSLYRRYEDAKNGRNKTISEEDMQKYVGMTPDELSKWSQDRPGVAGNQNAGSITAGPASGLGGYNAGSGYGGWGPDANGKLKFPPQKPTQ
ncbi:hypothetical protein VP1G_03650 [Cytospora mali]|uniref:Uncharacterized protein n=1 Tax=Cytospora mali TaxID=578113 RepID=A0A194UX57_CYTMA|nr:hypothetical protein VP1G_03650 [Valsa mali var. pyri (nom. inval.)]